MNLWILSRFDMKIVLDTNIISELMKSSPDSNVVAWVDQQNVLTLYITSVSIAEIHYGLSVLSVGKKRHDLEKAFNHLIETAFNQRVLFFDNTAAYHYGVIMAERKKIGKPMSIFDGQIAAMTKTISATLATRNTKDFIQTSVDIIDPFH